VFGWVALDIPFVTRRRPELYVDDLWIFIDIACRLDHDPSHCAMERDRDAWTHGG
jgi:hypothetical protein